MYPDCLLPIAPDYTMIEAAVVECAYAGCDTIWIVCNDDISPVIRHKIGDFIQDPVYLFNGYGAAPSTTLRRIPIYWVPIHPKDRDRRDCLSWSVIHGALSSFKVASSLSAWLIPDKYYVSFPHGLFDPKPLQKLRTKIKTQNNFYVSSDNNTVQNDYYTSFTFGKDEFVKYRRNIRKGTGMWSSEDLDSRGIPTKTLPIEERWSAKHFKLSDVFKELDITTSLVYEAPDFYNLADWNSYRNYLASEFCETVSRPPKEMFYYREFNYIGEKQ